MSTLRTIGDFPRNESGYVDRFIGTAYDTVKKVADNLDDIVQIPAAAAEVLAAQTDIDQKATEVATNTQTVADNLALSEAAKNAAMAAANLYPTIGAGLAATADQGYFVIAGPANGKVFSTLYQNDGGNPVLINTYPTTEGAWDRSNHTGTQAISTISGLQTSLDGKVNAKSGLIYGSTSLTSDDTGSLSSVSAKTILADEYLLRANGAKFDGVTDDSAAFQKILNSLPSQKYLLSSVPSVIFKLPANCECRISTKITSNGCNVAIIGSGVTTTKLVVIGTLDTMWVHGDTTTPTLGTFEVRDIAVINWNNSANSTLAFSIYQKGGNAPSVRVTNVEVMWFGQAFNMTNVPRDINFTNVTVHGPDNRISDLPGISVTSTQGGKNVFTTSWIMCNVFNYSYGWYFEGKGMMEGHRFYGSTCYNGWGMVQAYVHGDGIVGLTGYQAVIWDFYCCDWQGLGYALDMKNCRGVRVRGGFYTFNDRTTTTGKTTTPPWGARTSAATNAMFSFVNCADVVMEGIQIDSSNSGTYGDCVIGYFDSQCTHCRVYDNAIFINSNMYGGFELGAPSGGLPANTLKILSNEWLNWVGGDKVIDHGSNQIDVPWIEDNYYGSQNSQGFFNIQQQVVITPTATTVSGDDSTVISHAYIKFPTRRYGRNLFNGGVPTIVYSVQQALVDSAPQYWMGASDNAGFYINFPETSKGVQMTINYIAQGY